MNLMDTIRGIITPEMSNRAATSLGEPPDKTHRTMLGAVPTVLAGFSHRVSTPQGASAMHDLLRECAASGGVEKLAAGGDVHEVEEQGKGMLSKLFGDRSVSVGEALGRSGGVKSSSALRILALAGPLVAGVLGKEVIARGVGADGLAQMLSSHRNTIFSDPQAPRDLAAALGPQDQPRPETAPATAREPREPRATPAETPSRFARAEEPAAPVAQRRPWGIIVPALVAVLLIIWGISAAMRGHGPRRGATAPQPSVGSGAPPQGAQQGVQNPPGTTGGNQTGTNQGGPTTQLHLPGGKTIAVPANGAEAAFGRALADNSPLPRTFSFDELKFEPGSVTPTADANNAIGPVAAMLQAYPSAHVRVEASPDRSGDPASNRSLAESRANAVKQMLVSKDVPADRIDTGARGQGGGTSSEPEPAAPGRAQIVLLSR